MIGKQLIKKLKTEKHTNYQKETHFILGACTKGSTAVKSLRNQPFNEVKAKQRAYSLKQGYVNHIIANIAQEEQAVYGKILTQETIFEHLPSIEEIVISKFAPFYGKTSIEIEEHFNLELNRVANRYLCYPSLRKSNFR